MRCDVELNLLLYYSSSANEPGLAEVTLTLLERLQQTWR